LSLNPVRLLVLEDDASLSEILCESLRDRGHEATPGRSVAEALALLDRHDFEVALLDLMLPDGSGLDVLQRIVDEELPTEAIILTGYATVDTALRAMKLGAYDYLTKPARVDEMEVLVEKAAEKARLRRENVALRTRLERQEPIPGLITQDPGMRDLLATLERVASTELPVLIVGETGTGKELVARALHQRSPRRSQPFVAINCGAVPETLIESELFGYEKGAFTGALGRKPGLFEVADHGVLFLDEIGDISALVQVKILRALETKEFYRVGGMRSVRSDVRVVAASNKDLEREIESGRFRQDLYYRVDGITLRLPPLRERPDDIALLSRHFLDRFAPGKRLSRSALDVLQAHSWPGNVRELQMAMQRAAALAAQDVIEPDDIPLRGQARQDWTTGAARAGLSLEDVERHYIQAVLDANQGHRGRTAKALGLDPKTLYNRLGASRPRKDSAGEGGDEDEGA
jgi:two-component system, NtrC family, response regulator AtoC